MAIQAHAIPGSVDEFYVLVQVEARKTHSVSKLTAERAQAEATIESLTERIAEIDAILKSAAGAGVGKATDFLVKQEEEIPTEKKK